MGTWLDLGSILHAEQHPSPKSYDENGTRQHFSGHGGYDQVRFPRALLCDCITSVIKKCDDCEVKDLQLHEGQALSEGALGD